MKKKRELIEGQPIQYWYDRAKYWTNAYTKLEKDNYQLKVQFDNDRSEFHNRMNVTNGDICWYRQMIEKAIK